MAQGAREDQWVPLVRPVALDRQALRENEDHRAHRVNEAHAANPANQDSLANAVAVDHLDPQEPLESEVPLARLVPQDQQDLSDKVEIVVNPGNVDQ